jgi:phosphoglycerate dehydrogenase-like enzyme
VGAFVPGGGRLPPGHDLWTLPGVFITPHVAASAPVSRQRAARLVREQAEAYLRGDRSGT